MTIATFNRTRRGPNYVGLAAIDTALWDAYAKTLGVPLGIAMGGAGGGSAREVPLYASGGFNTLQSPEEAAESAARQSALGCRGVKPRASGKPSDQALLEAVRKAIPDGVELMTDANEKCTALSARRLLACATDCGALFVEEPLPADDLAGYRALATAYPRLMATGEHLQGMAEALPYIEECLLGMVLDKKGDSDGALRQFQEAIRLLPHYPEVHNELGLVLDKKGDSDGALLEFLTAVRLEPASAGFRNNLGNALQKKGRTEEALPQYQEAIRLKPDFAAALNNLGYLWAARGENLDQAHALIEKAVRLEPKNAVFLDSLGWVLYRLNRPREALDYLLLAIENSSRPDASLYDHLGDVYAALHQREQAAGAWRHSLAVEPNPHIQKKLEDRATD